MTVTTIAPEHTPDISSDDGSQPEMKDFAVLGISTATKFAEIFTVYDDTYFRLRK
ncbi:MAG: hypothetical protein M3286_08075 [Thermoproteota archaeon]|nr:hypothetical protein [Thermoproteota archaeon]